MKIPLSWLQEYISLPDSLPTIEEALIQSGIEVEGIELLTPSFTGVVVAKVLETAPHPNADRLQVARVFDGQETVQVVCGATNCRPGIFVALAKIGAILQDEKGPWKIKKGKLRDVESFGMLCSGYELGLSLNAEDPHILELDSSLSLGKDVAALYSDTVLSLSLTPNLGHALSVYGIARELSAFLCIPLLPLTPISLTPTMQPSITIETPDLCPLYTCTAVASVQIGPSPFWLKYRLELCGIRSVNNAVDISNYVMLATGQPLHFFDLDALSGNTLYIRSLDKESAVTTLDGIERNLPKDTLVITDSDATIAVAGVIGCLEGAITDSTKNILIEAAVFDSASIRKTAKLLQLKTDASYRFERGTDPAGAPAALQLASSLLEKVAGATPSYQLHTVCSRPPIPKILSCRPTQVERLLGVRLTPSEIRLLLERIHCHVLEEKEISLKVRIPSYRNDLTQEIDLIEEIAKLYGFSHLPKAAIRYSFSPLPDHPMFRLEKKVRSFLLQEGLQEFLTCDLISPKLAGLLGRKSEVESHCIPVLHAKSQDYSLLRPSLLAGLLQVVKHNIDHQNDTIYGFEVGRVHFTQGDSFQEHTSIGIILSGDSSPYHIDPKPRPVDFFDLKGIVENLLDHFSVAAYTFTPSHLPYFQAGRQATIHIEGVTIGTLGEVHPLTAKEMDISQRVYFAELNVEMLQPFLRHSISIQELPLYPASQRDWTVTVTRETPVEKVLSCIRLLAPPLLENVFLLSVFASDKLGKDRKNVTWRFVYRDKEKTIDTPTVETIHTMLLQNVAQNLPNCIL